MTEPKPVSRWRTLKRAAIVLAAVIVSWFLYVSVLVYQEVRDYEEALVLYEAGEYDRAASIILPLAETWDIYSQYQAGLMYRDGNGVPQDYSEAHKWFLLAEKYPNSKTYLPEGYSLDPEFAEDIMREKEILEVGMTPEEISEGNRRAEMWIEKLIDEQCIKVPFSASPSRGWICLP